MNQHNNKYPFPHQRLDAHRVALELGVAAVRMSDRIPRGYRNLADQLKRAGSAVPALVTEGANRLGRGEKRQRFNEARAECGEVAGLVELLVALELVQCEEAAGIMHLAGREAAMLTKLVRRFS